MISASGLPLKPRQKSASPTMQSPLRPRDRATLIRSRECRKPARRSGFERVIENTARSASRPWNASTVLHATSTCCQRRRFGSPRRGSVQAGLCKAGGFAVSGICQAFTRRESFSKCPPGVAWATRTSSARAATNSFRLLASSAVTRLALRAKAERIKRRPAVRGSRHSGGTRCGNKRAGQMMMGCVPRKRMRRHSFSTGE